MTDWLHLAATDLLGTMRDVLPIAAVIIGFQVLALRRPLRNPRRIAAGFAFVILGLTLFLVGLDKALFPLGRAMAAQLTDPDFLAPDRGMTRAVLEWPDYYWVYLFAFCVGFATTIAEPSLIAVAIKANEVSAGAIGVWGLRVSVALGVAVGIALGTFRIITGTPALLHHRRLRGRRRADIRGAPNDHPAGLRLRRSDHVDGDRTAGRGPRPRSGRDGARS